jgi:glutathione peroxidase
MKLLKVLLVMGLFKLPVDRVNNGAKTSIYDVKVEGIDGEALELSQFKGKKNTICKCCI